MLKGAMIARMDKTCKKCDQTKSIELFGKASGGRRRTWCKDCLNEYAKSYHVKRCEIDPSYKERSNRRASAWAKRNPEKRALIARKRNLREKDLCPEKVKARALVNQRVRFKRMPKASSLNCFSCGKQAKHYHHHMGYEWENRYNVVPVCLACHANLG